MNKEEFKECSVVAYPRQIKFLHINGGAISYYVDRHVSDYVDRLQQENQEIKKQIEEYQKALDDTMSEKMDLEEDTQKYKEVIDKAINNSQYWIDYYTRLNSDERIALRLQENIDILKDVE